MVGLVTIPQPLEDGNGFFHTGFFDFHRLKTAFQSGVFLNVLAVLFNGGSTDSLQLATRQHGLQNRGSVNRAFCRPRTDQGMNLIDEQDDVPTSADFLQYLLETFLEVAAVARARHQRAHIQGIKLFIFQGFRDVAADNTLSQSFHHGGFTHPGFAHQDRIVLGAPGQNLHDAFHFLGPPDDRVKFGLARSLSEVASELVQNRRVAPRVGVIRSSAADTHSVATALLRLAALVTGQQFNDSLAHIVQISAEFNEDLGGDPVAFPQQPQQDMLGTDVVVSQLQGLTHRKFQHLAGARRKGNVAGGRLLTFTDNLNDLSAHGLQRDTHRLQCPRRNTVAFVNQTQ